MTPFCVIVIHHLLYRVFGEKEEVEVSVGEVVGFQEKYYKQKYCIFSQT